jgi:hypothetical protein
MFPQLPTLDPGLIVLVVCLYAFSTAIVYTTVVLPIQDRLATDPPRVRWLRLGRRYLVACASLAVASVILPPWPGGLSGQAALFLRALVSNVVLIPPMLLVAWLIHRGSLALARWSGRLVGRLVVRLRQG